MRIKDKAGFVADARDIADAELHAIDRDVIIIGSGAASAAMASRLLKRGLKVLVLEAGDRFVNSDSSPYIETSHSDPFGLSLQLGGSTNLWSGRTAPLEDVDMTSLKGWPFERAAIEDYYRDALSFLGLQPFETLSAIPAYNGPDRHWASFLADPRVSVKRFQWNRPVFNGLQYFDGLGQEQVNLTVLLNCRALGLVFDEPGEEVVAVKVGVGQGRVVQLAAPIFALCAGGLETPRVLLNSRGQNLDAMNNPNIGRFFSTHPKSNVGRVYLARAVSTKHPIFSDIADGQGEFRFGIGVAGEAFQQGGQLNHYVQFSPRFESVGLELLEHAQHVTAAVLGHDTGTDAPFSIFRRLKRKLLSLSIGIGRILFNLIGKLGLVGKKGTVLVVRGFFDQFPSPEHRVVLTDDLDPYGVRKARAFWSFSNEDKASVRTFLDTVAACFREHDLGVFKIELPAVGQPWKITEIHSHLLGTTRMGTSSADSVTDGTGRVHGVRNLYIGGASLFTSYGYANPVLTIMALAFLTADKICDHQKLK